MANITEDYVSFETAKLLKEKGFDELGDYYYTKNGDFTDCLTIGYSDVGRVICKNHTLFPYKAPTHQMAMKWLKKVHNIHIGINPISGKGYNATIYDVADFDDYGIISDTEFFFHVEEACEAAIKYCLEHLI